MMFHLPRLINRNQKGFTLIELMLAIAIGGLIAGGITAAIFQVVIGSARTNNHMIAVRQVQNAGYWVSHDAQIAQSIDIGGSGGGFPLTLTWTDWESNNVHQVTYTLVAMPGSELKNLQRSHSINGTTQQTGIMAQFIESTQTSCSWNNGVLAFNITATVHGQTETRVYGVTRRLGSY